MAWSMIFTVFRQCSGGCIVQALALLKGDLRAEAQQRVIACMLSLWVLMGTTLSLYATS